MSEKMNIIAGVVEINGDLYIAKAKFGSATIEKIAVTQRLTHWDVWASVKDSLTELIKLVDAELKETNPIGEGNGK